MHISLLDISISAKIKRRFSQVGCADMNITASRPISMQFRVIRLAHVVKWKEMLKFDTITGDTEWAWEEKGKQKTQPNIFECLNIITYTSNPIWLKLKHSEVLICGKNTVQSQPNEIEVEKASKRLIISTD